MKRFFAVPLVLMLVLTGCGNDSPVPPPTVPPTAPPTTPPTTPLVIPPVAPPVTPPIAPPVAPPVTPPVAPPPTTGGGSLAGTVIAPSGGDVMNTIVLACYNDSDNCTQVAADGQSFADGYSNLAVVQTSGESGAYSVDNLQAVLFSLIAARDLNGDGDLNAGDYIGIYTTDNQNITLVTPPQVGLAIQMIDAAELQSASRSDDSIAKALRAADAFLKR